MNIKIKYGADLISSFYCPKDKSDDLIINLCHRWSYKGFKQKGNHLIIHTRNGDVTFVFAGETIELAFESENKEQLIFNQVK